MINYNELFSWLRSYKNDLSLLEEDHEYLKSNRNNKIHFAVDFHEVHTYGFPFDDIYRIIKRELKDKTKRQHKDKLLDDFSRNYFAIDYLFNKIRSTVFMFPPHFREFKNKITREYNNIKKIDVAEREKQVDSIVQEIKKTNIVGKLSTVEILSLNYKKYIQFELLFASNGINKLKTLIDPSCRRILYSPIFGENIDYFNELTKYENSYNCDIVKDIVPIDPQASVHADARAFHYVDEFNKKFDKSQILFFISNSPAVKDYAERIDFKYFRSLHTMFVYFLLVSDIDEPLDNYDYNNIVYDRIIDEQEKVNRYLEKIKEYKNVLRACKFHEKCNYDECDIENKNKCKEDIKTFCKKLISQFSNIEIMKNQIENINIIIKKYGEHSDQSGVVFRGDEREYLNEFKNILLDDNNKKAFLNLQKNIEFKKDITWFQISACLLPITDNNEVINTKEYHQFPFMVKFSRKENKDIIQKIGQMIKDDDGSKINLLLLQLLEINSDLSSPESWLVLEIIFFVKKEYEQLIDIFHVISNNVIDDKKLNLDIFFMATKGYWELNVSEYRDNKELFDKNNLELFRICIRYYDDDFRFKYVFVKTIGQYFELNRESDIIDLFDKNIDIASLIHLSNEAIQECKNYYLSIKNKIGKLNIFYKSKIQKIDLNMNKMLRYMVNNHTYLVSLGSAIDVMLEAENMFIEYYPEIKGINLSNTKHTDDSITGYVDTYANITYAINNNIINDLEMKREYTDKTSVYLLLIIKYGNTINENNLEMSSLMNRVFLKAKDRIKYIGTSDTTDL